VISADHASKLLDHVIYEHVLDCIDLDALYNLEQTLWYALGQSGVPAEDIGDIAHEMIGKALDQVRHDERRELIFGSGEGLDCDLCERAARASSGGVS
jgi:hypothetical protein